jgi:citrate synthase
MGTFTWRANQAVLEMLEEIHQNGEGCLYGQSQRQNDPFRLMGFVTSLQEL